MQIKYIFFLGVYTTFDDLPVLTVTHERTRPSIDLTCYSQHLCLYHKVHIVWFIKTKQVHATSEQIFTSESKSDMKILEDNFGISVTSRCPAYECHSTLTMKQSMTVNSEVWCGGYTEACPGSIKHNSTRTVVIAGIIIL